MSLFTLHPSQTILLIVDMQEKIFSSIDRGADVLYALSKLIKGFEILDLPILQSEQYPQGLGPTLASLQALLNHAYRPSVKSTFSCLDDPDFLNKVTSLPYQQWIVVGIEAHVCVLQTVKGLLKLEKQVTVLQDAIGSRLKDCLSIAIEEMREAGARISCVETVLFELLKDSKDSRFKAISHLIKNQN